MMDKHAIKEKGKQLIDHLPGWGDIHGAFTWQDRQGKRHQLSVGPKLVTLAALSTAFCAVALAVCAGLLSRAWAEQEELQHYRAEPYICLRLRPFHTVSGPAKRCFAARPWKNGSKRKRRQLENKRKLTPFFYVRDTAPSSFFP